MSALVLLNQWIERRSLTLVLIRGQRDRAHHWCNFCQSGQEPSTFVHDLFGLGSSEPELPPPIIATSDVDGMHGHQYRYRVQI